MGDKVAVDDDLGMIKYKGDFDLKGLLRLIHHWIVHQGYDFFEDLHKAKLPELELNWHGEKKVEAYYKYYVNLSFKFFDLRSAEVAMPDGTTKKVMNGRFWIKFGGEIERDFEGTWGEAESRLRTRLKKFFEASTKREFLANHAGAFVDELRGLMAQVKSYLGMEGV